MFFKKKPPETPSASKPSLIRNSAAPFEIFPPHAGPLAGSPMTNTSDHVIIDVDASFPGPLFESITTPSVLGALSVSSILSELECTTASLPLSIPEGLETDILARFSGNPSLELEEGQDAWEMADQALNRAIGFGKSVDEVAEIIRRGPLGMDGFCRWLRALVYELKVDECLLEGKIKRLIDAMVTM